MQGQLNRGSGVVQLPDGVTILTRELKVPANSAGLEIKGGKDSVLKAAPNFAGRAFILVQNASRVTMRNFRLEGNRADVDRPMDLPSASSAFLSHFPGNGILVDDSKDIEIADVTMNESEGFAILASRVKKIRVQKLTVDGAGGRQEARVGHDDHRSGGAFDSCARRRPGSRGPHSLLRS